MGDNIEIIDSYTVILQEDQNTQTQNVDIASPIQIQTIESNAQSLTIETQQQIDLYMDKQGTPIINLKGVAQEQTLIEKTEEIKDTIVNTTPKVDLTPVAKESTLNSAKAEIITAIDNATPEIDLTEVAKETTLNSAKEEILTAVEKGAQESTLLAESAAIKQAIASAKPEVDLSGVAQESTLEEVKQAVDGAMGTLSNKYNEYDEAVSAQLSMLTEDDNPTAQGQVSCLRTLVGQTAGLIEQGNTLADALGKAAMAQEILKGKEELVYVINAMGGHVSIGDSFTTLAEAIENDIELLDPRTTFTDDMVYPINLATYAAQPKLLRNRVKSVYSEALSVPSFENSTTVEKIYYPNATSLYNFRYCTNLKEVYCPNVTSINTFTVNSSPKVEVLNVLMSKDAGTNQNFNGATNLIDLIIGKGFESSVSFTNKSQAYKPTTAYSKATNSLCHDDDIEKYGQTFETNWHKWKWCIINHFAANLTDLTGLDSFTITFGATVLAQFDEEMIAAFTNKNWTLA